MNLIARQFLTCLTCGSHISPVSYHTANTKSSHWQQLSAPRENVLLVPDRNVRLTESGWGGERRRSSDHDPQDRDRLEVLKKVGKKLIK